MRSKAALATALLTFVGVLAIALSACGGGADSQAASTAKKREDPRPERVSAADAAHKPNVIFIYTDDQNLADFKPKYMPRTFKLLADPGTFFENYVVSTPLCCPSRASYMTGDYPHNDGVFSNPGGYRHLKGKFNTLPVWMRNAGYRTSWVGKYLQGYVQNVPDPYKAAPGIDDWHATFEPLYYDYDMSDNGKKVHYGNKPRDYYTNVITRIAENTITEQAERKRPLFMTINNLAPHHGRGHGGRCTDNVVPAPRDVDLFKNAKVPRTPNFNEKDVSDKPGVVVSSVPLRPQRIAKLDLAYGCRLASLRGVDRSIASIYDAVDKAGELDNTVFVFSSDNGILEGQHRIGGKNIPYEEALRQPMVILAGKKALGGSQVPEVSQLTANIDFAPTILQLGDAKPCARPGNCRELDGQSLVPLLKGAKSASSGFNDRDVLIEGGKGGSDCLYAGIRTPHLNYVVHAEKFAGGACDRDAGEEMYDLDGSLTGRADPYELRNLLSTAVPAHDDPKVKAEAKRLSDRLAELKKCSGSNCR
jgi:N-acetylglucosamine-6-sulfatase